MFVTPRGRLESGYYGTTAPAAVVFAMTVVVVLLVIRKSTRWARSVDFVAAAVLGGLLLLSVATLAGYLTMWYTTTSLLPVGVVLGAVLLARRRPAGAAHSAGESYLFLLLALAAFVALVQFPFGAPVYFCFVAPLAVLAWLAMFRHTALRASAGRVFPVALLAGIVGFGFVVNHSVLYRDGTRPDGNPQTVVLDRDRAWIRVSPSHRDVYLEVMALLRAHARGSYVVRRPGHARDLRADGASQPDAIALRRARSIDSARGAALLETLDERRVTAIVINSLPAFSEPLEPDVVARLRSAYPHQRRVGPFEIRWKSASSAP